MTGTSNSTSIYLRKDMYKHATNRSNAKYTTHNTTYKAAADTGYAISVASVRYRFAGCVCDINICHFSTCPTPSIYLHTGMYKHATNRSNAKYTTQNTTYKAAVDTGYTISVASVRYGFASRVRDINICPLTDKKKSWKTENTKQVLHAIWCFSVIAMWQLFLEPYRRAPPRRCTTLLVLLWGQMVFVDLLSSLRNGESELWKRPRRVHQKRGANLPNSALNLFY